MSKERKSTYNYILNDIAFSSLLVKCLYSEYSSSQDKYDLEYQIRLMQEKEDNLQQENKQLKELKYKFFDNSDDEESFTLEDYLEISNELYDYEEENKQLKDGLHKILDLNKRAINCDSQKVTIKYLLKQYDLIYETLGELQPGLMKGNKENE